jgi:hypothetical protein
MHHMGTGRTDASNTQQQQQRKRMTTMAKNTEQRLDGEVDLPPADDETGEITENVATSLILDAFKGAGVQQAEANDPMVIQQQIVNRLLKAQSMDDLFSQFEAKTIDKYEGEIITIHSVEWGIFNSDDGPIPLGRLEITTPKDDSKSIVIATSPNLTAFVATAERLGGLPFTTKIVGAKTARGFTALHFERA